MAKKEIDTLEIINDNVLVEPDLANAARVTGSGIFLTARSVNGKTVHQIPKSGYIRGMGPNVPDHLKIGQRVIINIDKVIGVRLNRDEGYLVVKPEQILGEVLGDGHIS